MGCHRTKHTSCCRNTDPFQLFTDRFLQFLFHHTDGVSYLLDIMYLSVQHSTGIVLLHPLCYNNEPVLIPVAYRSHNTSGSNIQTKHICTCVSFFFDHRYSLTFLSICSKLSLSSPLLSITKWHAFRYSSSESCDCMIASIFSSE